MSIPLAGCGHPDPHPYGVRVRLNCRRWFVTTLCRGCYEDACRRAHRESMGTQGTALGGDRRRKGRHVSNAA